MAGVSPTGYVAKTIEEIVNEIEADELAIIDPALVLTSDQPIVQLNGIFSKKLAELWELGGVAYNAIFRDAAENFLLDNIGDLTGTPRDASTRSTVVATVNLGASYTQGVGVMVAQVVGTSPPILFRNKNAVVSTTAGNYSAIFESVDYGPITANAGTLTVIAGPVSGWNSITNALDATLGTLTEVDPPYRVRQRDELSAAGSATPDGIRADVLKVPGVQQAFVFENLSDVTDGNGVPPHAYETVIYDGATPLASNAAVWQVIWNDKPSGIQAYGTTVGNATASDGTTRSVGFSRAAVVDIWLVYSSVLIDPAFFPVDGVAQIIAAAAARGAAIQKLGTDVIALQYKAAALSVPGVIDATTLLLGTAPSPVGTANIVIGSRQIARVDSSHITVGTLVPA